MTKPFEIVNNTKVYHFKASLNYLSQLGKQHYGTHFKIHPADIPIIYKLIIYAIQDSEKCQQQNIDLTKGILLLGPIGCGKTSLMHLLNYFTPNADKHIIYPSREIAFEFINKGYTVIQHYGKMPKTLCFDDLGLEQNIKYYGNNCNVMAEVLLSRYDVFISHKKITHATSNLNATELENLYGKRVRSRLRAMFNLIAFPNSTPDKRI